MTGRQFSVALNQLGWDVDQAANRLGQRRDRILAWLKETQDIPPWCPRLLGTLATVEGAKEQYERIHHYLNDQEHNAS